ncbi:MAG: serine beta-lactamase-like protein LACTB [Oceanospirillaceae bacterium]|jgi:serine beta-lactamase-like protein LACTB
MSLMAKHRCRYLWPMISRILTFLFLLIANQSFAQDFAKEDSLLQSFYNTGAFQGGGAGFATAGEIRWSKSIGMANAESESRFTTETPTRIASIAKPMTAIAIMQLVEAGKLDLDQPIQTYLSNYPEKKEGTQTTRQYLNHTSGTDHYKNGKEANNMKHHGSLKEATEVFKDRKLVGKPGEVYNYTSYGYVVLGRIIESVSGMSYGEYMHTNIREPADMTNTSIEPNGEPRTDRTECYSKGKKGFNLETRTDISDRIPSGGLYSTVTDVLKFGMAVLENKLIKPETLSQMPDAKSLKKEGKAYVLGWYHYGENPKYGEVFGHSGRQIGCSAF